MQEKYSKLKSYINSLESVLVCYSGGTDSTLLLYTAKQVLGDKAQGIFFDSAVIPEQDKRDALITAAQLGVDVTSVKVNIFEVEGLQNNPENRCYICKHNLLTLAKGEAERLGFRHVLEGSHADDLHQHRPGRKAVEEHGVLSPFEKCNIGKAEISQISKEAGLSTWNKPSYSCLITRLPHNEPVLEENMRRIELLEQFMRGLGLREFRVRHSAKGARVEVIPAEQLIVDSNYTEITKFFRASGYESVDFAPR